MLAIAAPLLKLLKEAPQFIIPIYQRTYSWQWKECRQLWDDIIRVGKNEKANAHFVGSIVYIAQGLSQITVQSPYLVIDGQQRLTTVTLLLEALAQALGDKEPVDGFSAIKLRRYYLLNELETGERRYKLILSQTDKTSLIALLEGQPQPDPCSLRISENFKFLQDWLKQQPQDIAHLCNGLAKLIVVDVSLSRDQDNPQLIFESMNSTGRELSQADLIRNFVLMGLEPKLQTSLYENYWRRMEVGFGQEAYATHFDGFMRHYLTLKTGEIPNVRDVYEAFKKYAQSGEGIAVEKLVADLAAFAGYYCKFALDAETDPQLKQTFHDIRELRVDVAYPLFLDLYHDYATSVLTREELLQAIRVIESYVFRRAICAIPTNSLNKTFAALPRQLKKDRYLESLEARLLLLPSYRRFPTDEEVEREIQRRDLYHFRNRTFLLNRLENFGRKERVPVGDYTIEHILPQNEKLSAEWQTDLGPEWQRIRTERLHTLGNLTLTGYNSEYSDRPFQEKRDITGGFAQSPLRLNQGLGALQIWNEKAIAERAERLAKDALKLWPAPKLDPSVLAAYRPQAPLTGFTIADHPFLVSGPSAGLFEAFRKEVLALDPCVTEQFLKLYVAYKAETNFVDVIPQAKRLLLSLNISFHEIEDPRGLCKNVAGLGRWGNGDVEVGLASMDELPYVVGLVRQALELQLGSNGEA